MTHSRLNIKNIILIALALIAIIIILYFFSSSYFFATVESNEFIGKRFYTSDGDVVLKLNLGSAYYIADDNAAYYSWEVDNSVLRLESDDAVYFLRIKNSNVLYVPFGSFLISK